MDICAVQYCRYAKEHITKFHLCGNCQKLGHGQVECENESQFDKMKLLEFEKPHTINVEKYCEVLGCLNRSTHSSKSHNSKIDELMNDCVQCPLCKSVSVFDEACRICLINIVNLCLKCGHDGLCLACFDIRVKLNKN
jgi:hypothetical protein